MSSKVLSVNGSKPMNYMLQTVLSVKYDLKAVTHALQGLHLLKSEKNFKAIVIDLDFNTQENKEFIQFIKSSKLYHRPLMLLTSDVNQAKELPMGTHDKLFVKPFNPTELSNAIQQVVNHQYEAVIQ